MAKFDELAPTVFCGQQRAQLVSWLVDHVAAPITKGRLTDMWRQRRQLCEILLRCAWAFVYTLGVVIMRCACPPSHRD